MRSIDENSGFKKYPIRNKERKITSCKQVLLIPYFKFSNSFIEPKLYYARNANKSLKFRHYPNYFIILINTFRGCCLRMFCSY